MLEAQRQLDNPKYYSPLPAPIFSDTQEKVREIFRTLRAKNRFLIVNSLTSLERTRHVQGSSTSCPKSIRIPPRGPSQGRFLQEDQLCLNAAVNPVRLLNTLTSSLIHSPQSILRTSRIHITSSLFSRPSSCPDALLFSINVGVLYTNIDTRQSLEAVRGILQQHPDEQRPDEELLQLLELGLSNNDFTFNGKYYLQVHGTAMGKKFAK